MKKLVYYLWLISLLILSACTTDQVLEEIPTAIPEIIESPTTAIPTETQLTQEPTEIPEPTPTPTAVPKEALTLEETSEAVIQALSEKDLETLSTFVHPEMGVRFSPYAYVREEHQVFMPDALSNLAGTDDIYVWGNFDGTGDPIEMTFDDYFDRFVYSADFADPEEMAVDERLGQGNTINNIHAFYPGSSFVEYHFSGFDEQYEGMDWQSLRLVFVQEEGSWFLVGVVHDEWTI